jgi:MATE family multidrug resistance protein
MTGASLKLREQHPWRHELRVTLALAWPLILSNLTMALIGATDVLMLGWLGARELAGAMTAAIFCMGLITASAPMMATEIGRMQHSVRDVRRTFRQAMWAAFAVLIPFWILLWNTESLLLLFGQEADLAAIAGTYISAYMWSILPFLFFIILRNFISALEQPVWALIISVIGVLSNALFNYALIFGKFGVPEFGVVGAGIGSVMTNVLMFGGMVLVVLLHKRFRRYHLFGRFWRSDWPRFRAMWKLGLPIAITMGLEGSVFGVAALLMGLISAESVAAHAIALQLAALTFMVPMGLGQAATVRVGIQYGRKNIAGITRAGWVSFALGTSCDGAGVRSRSRFSDLDVHRRQRPRECRSCCAGGQFSGHCRHLPDCRRRPGRRCRYAPRPARHDHADAVRTDGILVHRHRSGSRSRLLAGLGRRRYLGRSGRRTERGRRANAGALDDAGETGAVAINSGTGHGRLSIPVH